MLQHGRGEVERSWRLFRSGGVGRCKVMAVMVLVVVVVVGSGWSFPKVRVDLRCDGNWGLGGRPLGVLARKGLIS